MNYYPVHCKKGHELRATMQLNNQYPDRCHCPLRFDLRKKKVPLWDCYVLLQLELGEDDISQIRSTIGVGKGLLRFGDHYGTIPDEIAEVAIDAPISYEQAKQIRILTGSFQHLILDLESANEVMVKAWVTILGKPQLVEFEHDRIVFL